MAAASGVAALGRTTRRCRERSACLPLPARRVAAAQDRLAAGVEMSNRGLGAFIMPEQLVRRLPIAVSFLCLLLVGLSAHGQVELPHGQFFLNRDDLLVKVMGGQVGVKRTWYRNQWNFNRAWNPLQFTFDSLDGSVKAIVKNGDQFDKKGGLYAFGNRQVIQATASGYRWQNRSGNWIEYDSKGRIRSYGDRSNVRVNVLSDDQGRIVGAQDHFGTQVLWYEYQGGLVSAVRDAANRRVQYVYANGRLVKYFDLMGNAWLYNYNSSGHLTSITDPENQTTKVAYDASGRVSSIRDNDGRGADYRYDYDKSKRQYYVQETTVGGKILEMWYDADGMLVRSDINGQTVRAVLKDGRTYQVTGPRGTTSAVDYDEWDNPVKITYADGRSEQYTYDSTYSNVLDWRDEGGVIFKYDYDSRGRLTQATEAVGRPEQRIVQYGRDEYGNVTTVRRLADDPSAIAERSVEYDDRGNAIRFTDAEGKVTLYDYDVLSNLVSMTDARGKTWRREYDNRRRLTARINPLGDAFHFEYDRLGRPVRATNPNGESVSLVVNAAGDLLSVTDPAGNATTLTYGPDGERSAFKERSGASTVQQFDSEGRLRRIQEVGGSSFDFLYEDSTGKSTGALLAGVRGPTFTQKFLYDQRDRVIATQDWVGDTLERSARYEFDVAQNLSRYFDPEGKSSTSQYDAFNRLLTFVDPNQYQTRYTYDKRNNLVQLNDAADKVSRFEYDRENRLVKEVRASGQTFTYTYDAVGNLIERVDALGQIYRYAYDDAWRLISEEHLDASGALTKFIVYSYDQVGRLTAYDDGETTGSYRYDTVGRKIAETVNYGSFALSYAYAYYPNGQKKSFTAPDGVTYTYTYDAASRLDSVQLPVGAISFSAHRWSLPTKVSLPGGVVQSYEYDSLMRINQIDVKSLAGTSVYRLGLTYNKSGQITSRADDAGTLTYAYDNGYRLTDVSAGGQPLEHYTLDAVGNRLTDIGASRTWQYGDNHELMSVGAASFEYDANGDLVRRTDTSGVTRYIRDVAQRLVRVEDATGHVFARYYYDPYGRRLWKEAAGVRTYFQYADEGLTGEYNATGKQLAAYGYLADSTWGTAPLFIRRDGEYFFVHNNELGAPQKLTRLDGSVVWSARYSSFGQATISANSTVSINLRLPGQYYDGETGLHYNGMRYYDPILGRYIEADPIGLTAGTNLYLYANGNPINWIDPTGRAAAPALNPVTGEFVWVAATSVVRVAVGCWGNPWCVAGVATASIATYLWFHRNQAGIPFICIPDPPRIPGYGDDGPPTVDPGNTGPPGYGPNGSNAGPPDFGPPPYPAAPPAKPSPGGYGSDGAPPQNPSPPGYAPDVPPGINDPMMSENGENGEKSCRNPNGCTGKQDHRDKVGELADRARAEAKEGEQVLENKQVRGYDSRRKPDVQIVDEEGRTRQIYEAERYPDSKRNRDREAEYDRLGIPHETQGLVR
jgi:RHS repeat-associated protein